MIDDIMMGSYKHMKRKGYRERRLESLDAEDLHTQRTDNDDDDDDTN